jgi:hypothetical protein
MEFFTLDHDEPSGPCVRRQLHTSAGGGVLGNVSPSNANVLLSVTARTKMVITSNLNSWRRWERPNSASCLPRMLHLKNDKSPSWSGRSSIARLKASSSIASSFGPSLVGISQSQFLRCTSPRVMKSYALFGKRGESKALGSIDIGLRNSLQVICGTHY